LAIGSGTAWRGDQITDTYLATISTAGKVSGSAITSGTIAGTTAISSSGNIYTTGSISTASSVGFTAGNFANLGKITFAEPTYGYQGTLQPVAPLNDDRTWYGPDVSGTIITTGNLSSITATGTIASGTWHGTAITDTYLATISTAGKVSGSAITSGTIAGTTAFQSSGLIETSNTTSASAATYGRFSGNTLSFANSGLETNSGKIDFAAVVASQLNVIGYGTTTSNRLIAFYDIPKFTQVSTGSGIPLDGANCPATTLTAPYTWLKVQSSDGSTVYIAAYK
jgi:hypothetical protein